LIWALNQPFAGLICVEPVAFHQVWSIIEQSAQRQENNEGVVKGTKIWDFYQ